MESRREKRMTHKREHDMQVLGLMVGMYCHQHHGTHRGELCPDCWSLLEYARDRLNRCPHMEEKPFCTSCPDHCYSPQRSQQIRTIMRWAGPRMILHQPLMALRYQIMQKTTRMRAGEK